MQGWLGSKDAILHSGEGPIQEIKWSGSLISWANDLGVKVYDTTIHQRIAYIERPRSRCTDTPVIPASRSVVSVS